jgi:two-component system sensor histidine kinase MprB
MLANLEQAREAQQQLVADASHELRTPLTSLRTNIEVLALDTDPAGESATTLSASDRRRLLDDLTVQLDEFGRLVGALIELARGAQPARAVSRVALDELVEAATDRARAFAGPAQRFDVVTEPVTVEAEADRLDRAVANLLDNAVKYGGGGPIDVRVSRQRNDADAAVAQIAVRDHGPGIAAHDLPHVFERFYRAPDVRDTRGSGLGLAIVQQVAEAHRGRTVAEPADGGGMVMALQLPLDGRQA